MSYRELRNFCEIMRALGFPRLISIENFRKPNFELVAEILYWLVMRYDPNADLIDDIQDEDNRVQFIKSVAQLFASKARIKLNTRKLYQSDGYAVQEILKIATMLYKAYFSKGHDDEEGTEFSLPSKLSNVKATKAVAGEITEVGAKLYDLLGKENELKVHRDKAISFLENISRNLESNNEQQYIEKCVREIIQQQADSKAEMLKYVQNLENDERTLDERIKKKSLDLERAEKRLKTISNVKPAFMDEYERLEKELEKIYNIYLDKFRNLDYLEHQLDLYNQAELEKFEDSQKKLEKLAGKIKDEEMKMLRGDQEIDESQLDADAQLRDENFNNSRGQSRSSSKPGSKSVKKRNDGGGPVRNNFGGGGGAAGATGGKQAAQQGGKEKRNYGNLQPGSDDEEEHLSQDEDAELGEDGEDDEEEDRRHGNDSDSDNF